MSDTSTPSSPVDTPKSGAVGRAFAYLRRETVQSRAQIAPTEGGTTDVSVPLYVAGAIVQVSGLAAVSYQLGEASFAYFTIVLTLIGMMVSFQLRRIGTHPRLIKSGTLLLGLVFLYALRGAGFFGQIVPVEARGSQEMLLVSALAFTATFCSFLLLSDDAVVFTCVWAIALIGLTGTVNINRELVICFIIFLLGASFLLIHQNALAQNRAEHSTTPRLASAAGQTRASLLRAQGFMAALAWAASLCLGFLIAIPVQMVGRNLSLATIIQRLRVPPSAASRAPGLPRLSFDNLQQFNVGLGPIEDDPTERLAVLSEKPHYWRGRVYDRYTGQSWINSDNDGVSTSSGEQIYPTPGTVPDQSGFSSFNLKNYSPKRVRTTRVTHRYHVINGTIRGPLYHCAEPVIVRAPLDVVRQQFNNTIGTGQTSGDEYEVVSEDVQPRDAELRNSSTQYPTEVRSRYLSGVLNNDALDQLAREAISGTVNANPFDRAQAIRRFVGARCVYTRDARPVPQGRDAAEFFLNDTREGYCDLYATAMVVLCRYAGIPARMVTGFAPGTQTDNYPGKRDPKDKRKAYLLRGSDLHAWAEVYFTGYGWIPFDATTETVGSYNAPRTPEPVQSNNRWERFLKSATLPLALIGLGVLGVFYVVGSEIAARLSGRTRANGATRNTTADEVVTIYRKTARSIARKALPRPLHLTPTEYVQQLHDVDSAIADAFAPLTMLTEQALYGPQTIGSSEVTQARQAAAQVSQAVRNYRPPRRKSWVSSQKEKQADAART